MKVREEIGNALDVRQRNLGAARESFQLVSRKVTMLLLNLSQVIEDQIVL